MGNQQSAVAVDGQQQRQQQPEEQVIRPKEPATSVQFAPSLIQQLSSSPSADDSTASHSHHDSAIMSRLQAETARLRHDEAQIMASISSALEKENLDKEKPGLSSEILSRDIEEIRNKVDRLENKRKGVLEGEGERAELRKSRDNVVQCYLSKKDRPLDCWREVEQFKQSVGKLEQEFVASLR